MNFVFRGMTDNTAALILGLARKFSAGEVVVTTMAAGGAGVGAGVGAGAGAGVRYSLATQDRRVPACTKDHVPKVARRVTFVPVLSVVTSMLHEVEGAMRAFSAEEVVRNSPLAATIWLSEGAAQGPTWAEGAPVIPVKLKNSVIIHTLEPPTFARDHAPYCPVIATVVPRARLVTPCEHSALGPCRTFSQSVLTVAFVLCTAISAVGGCVQGATKPGAPVGGAISGANHAT